MAPPREEGSNGNERRPLAPPSCTMENSNSPPPTNSAASIEDVSRTSLSPYTWNHSLMPSSNSHDPLQVPIQSIMSTTHISDMTTRRQSPHDHCDAATEKQRPESISKLPDHLTLRSASPQRSANTLPRRPPCGISSITSPPDDISRGPTHAYSLFQNSVEEDSSDETDIVTEMRSVGIIGGYHRQVIDTATEIIPPLIDQSDDLPPYTRYPDDNYGRRQGTAMNISTNDSSSIIPPEVATIRSATYNLSPTANITSLDHRRLTINTLQDTEGPNHVSMNHEYDPSIDDIVTPGSSPAPRPPSAESQRAITMSIEKYDMGCGWKRWARKRVGGVVPYWAVFTAAIAILLMGVVLGAVIGVYLGKHGNRDDNDSKDSNSQTKPQPISGSDVVALSSLPPGLPPLETGCYTLSPLITRNAPNDCLVSRNQDQAWSCNIPYSMYYLTIDNLPGQPNTTNYGISLITYDHRNNSDIPKYPWGAAPPVVTQFTKMQLVLDTFESNQGPAWWARIPYNKTVIIGEDRIYPLLEKRRKSQSRLKHGRGKSQVVDGDTYKPDHRIGTEPDLDDAINLGAVDGDKPWICTWPNTILEVYVYPEQQSNDYRTDPSPRRARNVEPLVEDGSDYESRYETPFSTPWPTPTTAVTTATMTVTSATPPGSSGWLPFEGLPIKPDIYPKVFKFKERRVPELGSSQATCRQVQVVNGGWGDIPIHDIYDEPIQIVLDEIDDDQTVIRRDSDGMFDHHKLLVRGSIPAGAELSDCGCLWWVF